MEEMERHLHLANDPTTFHMCPQDQHLEEQRLRSQKGATRADSRQITTYKEERHH